MIYALHIDASPAAQQVAHLLGALFDVAPADVRVLPSFDDLLAGAREPVLCIARARAGAFPCSLEIIVQGPTSLSGEEVAAQFARALGCACLLTDDASNPYLWTLVTQEGEVFQADVDEEALDREELRVVRIRHGGTA